MRQLQGFVRFHTGLFDCCCAQSFIIRIFIIGTYVYDHCHRISIAYTDTRFIHFYFAIIGQYGYSSFKIHTTRTV